MRQKNYGAKFEGNPWPILKRVLGYMLRDYKLASCVAVVCILISAISTLNGILFMQTLVDDYVEPLIGTANPDFGPLAGALVKLIAFYVVGILASFLYNRIVVIICQGAMRNIRVELFNHMQSLPIKYFDTHPHGDIMSVYTNDVDTLRQLMGQSIPQLINSSVTVVTTFASMLYMNIPLTIWTVFMVWVMTRAMGFIGSKSRKYFSVQQKSLGKVNAYIEEMMAGQKVVKVFCHEEKNLEEFTRLNDELRDSAYKANAFANIVMPVNGNLGYISYVVCIIIGAILALNGMFGLTLGTLISFIALNKSSTQPISQIGQQMNSVVMAVAGAERIFALMDEKPETDEGTTQLVNAREDAEGNLTECAERTGIWAWKHKTKTGEIIYKKLEGDVTFDDVDFGYEPDKLVLHNIKMYATPGQKIAFVGSTGAGKTTITNLINRFYDIADGKIRYDGININKIKKADLRRSLGMVLQDTHLFTGTVLDNIRYGRPDATDEEIMGALLFLKYMGRSPETDEVSVTAMERGHQTAQSKGMPIIPTIKAWVNEDYLEVAEALEQQYMNVNYYYYEDFFDSIDTMKRSEEPNNCQDMYKLLDTALQNVISRPGTANPQALLDTANGQFQRNYLDKL